MNELGVIAKYRSEEWMPMNRAYKKSIIIHLYEVMHVSDEYACVCAPDYVHIYVCLLSDNQTASLSDRDT